MKKPHPDRDLRGRAPADGGKILVFVPGFYTQSSRHTVHAVADIAGHEPERAASEPAATPVGRLPSPPPAEASFLRMQLHGTELTKTYRRWDKPDPATALRPKVPKTHL